MAGDELRLVELGEAAAQRAVVARVQRTVQLREDLAREVEAAVVDVRRGRGAAGAAVVVGDHRVARAEVVLVDRVGGRHEALVVRLQVVHHRLLDGVVRGAREQVDLGIAEVRHRVDRTAGGPAVGGAHERGDRDAGAVRHAAPGGVEHRAFGAVVRTASDHARAALEGGRVGHVQLHRHEAAGRQAGHAHLRRVGAQCRQRHGRRRGLRRRRDHRCCGKPLPVVPSHRWHRCLLLVYVSNACLQTDESTVERGNLRGRRLALRPAAIRGEKGAAPACAPRVQGAISAVFSACS
ncbi:hypothetical protein D9M69_506670 [compost metagenome]